MSSGSFAYRKAISALTLIAYLNFTLVPCLANYEDFRENPHHYKIKLHPVTQDSGEEKLSLKITGKWGSIEKPQKKCIVAKSFIYGKESEENIELPGLGRFSLCKNGDFHLVGSSYDTKPTLILHVPEKASLKNLCLTSLELNASSIEMQGRTESKFLKVISSGAIKNKQYINAETVEMEARTFINEGTIDASKKIQLKLKTLNNMSGKLHAGEVVEVKSTTVRNQKGSISGLLRTSFKIGKSLSNHEGIIGISGKNSSTHLNFLGFSPINYLGEVKGERVSIFHTNKPLNLKNDTIQALKSILHANNPLNLKNGTIQALKSITFNALSLNSSAVVFEAPRLYLDVESFSLDTKTKCDRTIIKRGDKENFKLTNPYQTEGTFEIWQKGLANEQQSIDLLNTRFQEVASLPEATHTLEIQSTLQADQGIIIHAPAALLHIGNEPLNRAPEVLLENASLKAYVSMFDLEKGTIAAQEATVAAPSGIRIGRLIKDPTREVFSTISSHGQCSGSYNLGGDVANPSYTFLNQELEDIYHSGHLFVLPVATPNNTVFLTKNLTHFKGPFSHQGQLFRTKNFILEADTDSICKASEIIIDGNIELRGKGNLHLKRVTGDLSCTYYRYCGNRISSPANFHYVNSEPAKCTILGELTSNSGGMICNEASILHIHQKAPLIKVMSTDFKSSLYQKFINGTPEDNKALYSGKANIPFPQRNVTLPTNHIEGRGWLPYVYKFLINTKNFEGAQIIFPAVTSFGKAAMLPGNNTQLQGNISAPFMLVRIGDGKLALGSPNPFYIEAQDPIRRLLDKGFSLSTTYVTPDLQTLLDQTRNVSQFHPYFKLRERFWFNERDAIDFYRDIQDHVVFLSSHGAFTKPQAAAVFSLSPSLLLERVREQCQEALMRGYIYENRPIDTQQIKELHLNATEYIKSLKASGHSDGSLAQALVLKDSKVGLPSKPIIYYIELMNEQGVKELQPQLFLPPAMLDDARGKRGGKIRTHVLGILPEDMSPQEMIAYFKDNPVFQQQLIGYFQNNPATVKLLADQAMQRDALIPNEQPSSFEGSATIYGEVDSEIIAMLTPGTLNIHADIKAKNAFLGSLFSDVHLKSIVERVYGKDSENFYDYIPLTARVAVDEILKILAKDKIIFQGAQTHSGLKTQIEALGSILDIPVPLVHQHVERFYHKKKRGLVRATDTHQQVSSHSSQGQIELKTTSADLYGTQIEANTGSIETLEYIAFHDVHHTHEGEACLQSKKKRLFGSSKTSKTLSTFNAISEGPKIVMKEVMPISSQKITLTNPTLEKVSLSAEIVRINQGTNQFLKESGRTKSSSWWQSTKQRKEQHRTFTAPTLRGPLEITSQQTILQVAERKHSSYVDQIRHLGGAPVYELLKEYHHSKSKKIQGPGIALSSLITIITAITTQGWGATLAGTLFEVAKDTVAATMWNAGITAVCTQAANGVLTHKGEPGKILKELTSEKPLKSVLTSIATAGLTSGIAQGLELPDSRTSLQANLQNTAVQTGVSTTFAVASGEQDLGEALKQAIRGTAASMVHAFAAKQIGQAYREGEIDFLIHKTSHFLAGGIAGAVISDNLTEGALAGAIGASTAELVADSLPSTSDPQIRANLGRIAAGLTALVTEQDVNTADFAATTALENNFWLHPAPTLEIEQQRLEMLQTLFNVATEEIPECVGLRGDMHARINKGFNSIQGLPFIGTLQSLHESYPVASRILPLPVQGILYSRSISHLGVDLIMPVSILDISLNLTVAGKSLGVTGKVLGTGLSRGTQFLSHAWPRIGAVEKIASKGQRIIQDLERWKFNPVIFDRTVTWTAPKGTQQTYKVFQRNDINWNMIRTEGPIKFRGKTNFDAASAGFGPQLDDGFIATLHHIGQDSRGALAEASTRYHGVGTKGQDILHSQFGKNKPNPIHPVDHRVFMKESAEYWKMRVLQNGK